jgi:hypothetical protein
LRGTHNLADGEGFCERFLRPEGEPADRGTVDDLAALRVQCGCKGRHVARELVPRAGNAQLRRVFAEKVGPYEVEPDQNEPARTVFGERQADRLPAAVADYSGVDVAGSETEAGGV